MIYIGFLKVATYCGQFIKLINKCDSLRPIVLYMSMVYSTLQELRQKQQFCLNLRLKNNN